MYVSSPCLQAEPLDCQFHESCLRHEIPGLEIKGVLLTKISAFSRNWFYRPSFPQSNVTRLVIPTHTVGCITGEESEPWERNSFLMASK